MTCRDFMDLSPLYLSRELDEPRAAALAAHLQSCRSCAAEIESMTELDLSLQVAVAGEPLDTSTLDGRIRRHIATSSRPHWIKWAGAAAGLAAALVIGVFAYRASTSTNRACAAAASDHLREVIQGEHRRWLFEKEALVTLASGQDIGSAAIERLSAAGLHLEEGKLCRLDGRLFVHLVYTDGAHRFSLFLRNRSGDPGEIKTVQASASQAAYFETAHVTAIIVGDGSGDSIRRLAQLAQAVL